MLIEFSIILCIYFSFVFQLKYHDTGRERDCLPQVGQWNMRNKVLHSKKLLVLLFNLFHMDRYHFGEKLTVSVFWYGPKASGGKFMGVE